MMNLPLKDIVSRNVIGVSPDTPVSEAVGLMRDNRISCLPVLVDGAPAGVFTERNILRFLSRSGRKQDVPVSQVMTTPANVATEDCLLYEAFNVLLERRVRHVVVVDDAGKVSGVLTWSDVIDQIVTDFMAEFLSVEGVMSRVVYTAVAEAPLREVLTHMADRSLSCVVAVKDSLPVGILSERDAAALASQAAGVEGWTLGQVMKSPVQTVAVDSGVFDAARIMRRLNIRRVVVVDEDGRVAGLVTQTDIAKGLEGKYVRLLHQAIEEKDRVLKGAVKSLEDKNVYLDQILRTSMDMGVVAVNEDLEVIYCNPAVERMLGFSASEVVGQKLPMLHNTHGVPMATVENALEKVRTGTCHVFEIEREEDGDSRYLRGRVSVIRDSLAQASGFVLVIQDITEVKKAEENFRYMAYHDILTGLPNRVSLNERLALELAHAERKQQKLAVMLIDLDHFKIVNDTMGHYAGDILLQEAAKRLQSTLRKSDTIARLGGDEFVVVLPDISGERDASLIAEKIVEVAGEPYEIKGQAVPMGLSLGISFYPVHAVRGKQLIEVADAAMYRAKAKGRDNGRSNYCLAEETAPGHALKLHPE